MTIPFLDDLVGNMRTRFDNHQHIVDGFKLIPSILASFDVPAADLEHLPSPIDFPTEFELRHEMWCDSQETSPATLQEAMRAAQPSLFPQICTLFPLLATIHITARECQRSIGALCRVKTYLRSAMGQDWFSALALCHINYSVPVDIEAVIDIFTRMHPRLMVWV